MARSPRSLTSSSRSSRAVRPPEGSRLLEALIEGWRPLSRIDVNGAVLLRSRGVTRRANSAVLLDPPQEPGAVDALVTRIEAMAEAAGDSAAFRVFEGLPPAELDRLLAERGYATTGASHILHRALDTGRTPPSATSLTVHTGALEEDWFEAAWQLAPRPGQGARETLRAILAGTPAVQATWRAADGAAVGIGRAALVHAGRQRSAVLNMIAVAPEQRRAGIATQISRALLGHAAAWGATDALLEVETSNPGAQALYRQLGFARISGYHYRVRSPQHGAT